MVHFGLANAKIRFGIRSFWPKWSFGPFWTILVQYTFRQYRGHSLPWPRYFWKVSRYASRFYPLTLQSLLFSFSMLFSFSDFPCFFFCAFFLSFPRISGVPRREKPLLFSGFPLLFFKKARVGGSGLRCFCKCMPSSWQKVVYTPPICITIRLPFVSWYFCTSIRVRGRWNTPHWCAYPLSSACLGTSLETLTAIYRSLRPSSPKTPQKYLRISAGLPARSVQRVSTIQESPGTKRKLHEFRPFLLWILVFFLGKQAQFTLNFCSGMPLGKIHELAFLWFGLPGWLLNDGRQVSEQCRKSLFLTFCPFRDFLDTPGQKVWGDFFWDFQRDSCKWAFGSRDWPKKSNARWENTQENKPGKTRKPRKHWKIKENAHKFDG